MQQNDAYLSMAEKIALITEIEKRQIDRWERLKIVRALDESSNQFKHALSREVIALIRSEKERLKALKQSIYG